MLYSIWLAVLVAHHEPWSDEAQSWLLARDHGFWFLQLTRIHYEGTPGLWTGLLWVLSHAGVSYTAMHWLTALSGGTCAVLILRYAPFPRWLRWSLPFSVAFLYQGPVVARSYSVTIVFLLVLAALYCLPRVRLGWPLLFCVLLAGSSLFGCSLAFGFAVLFVRKAWYARGRTPVVFAVAFLVGLSFAAWQAIPAPDLNFGVAGMLTSRPAAAHALASMTRIAPVPADPSVTPAQPRPVVPPVFQHAWQQRLWNYINHTKPYPKGVAVAREALFAVAALTYTVSGSVVLAVLFYAALLLWLWRRRQLAVALPLLLLATTAQALRFSEHHSLLLWTTLVATVWMAWPQEEQAKKNVWHQATLTLLTLVVVQQVLWGVACSWRDVRTPFDPSIQLADFLKAPQQAGKRIAAVNLIPVGAQPYFVSNPFFNQRATYWLWQTRYDPDKHLPELLAQHPDLILSGEVTYGDSPLANQLFPTVRQGTQLGGEANDQLVAAGWRESQRFCGQQPQHLGYAWQMCATVWVPPSVARRASALQ